MSSRPSTAGAELKTDIAPGVTAHFNGALMSRVIHNLLQNAYKYGVEGGHIWLTLRRTEQGAVLSVKDDGIGIAPENLDMVWQRFWQADTSRGDGQQRSWLGDGEGDRPVPRGRRRCREHPRLRQHLQRYPAVTYHKTAKQHRRKRPLSPMLFFILRMQRLSGGHARKYQRCWSRSTLS